MDTCFEHLISGHKGSTARESLILGYTPLIHLETTFNGLMIFKTVECSVLFYGKLFFVYRVS